MLKTIVLLMITSYLRGLTPEYKKYNTLSSTGLFQTSLTGSILLNFTHAWQVIYDILNISWIQWLLLPFPIHLAKKMGVVCLCFTQGVFVGGGLSLV